ncbi:hypothetical protein BCR36DRAFT_375640 [Piromyces finnis]|uniref:Peptidase S8/S53 domain-containing protein n=1 Tax=Piromyces finnis TaxID=1754191 RepID=A0A1Y1UKU4_9FUNG|nr:hypothetical protein BCR36DRAFT_375640 [Piromyces finnis]|eukprot:ORX38124.1 hypothetical protein BCR36DRAFT_375640 [Piromyces finnis]
MTFGGNYELNGKQSGIDNVGGDDKYDISMSEASTNIMNNKYYRKAKNSNYGEFVNIYAPYYVKYDYCDINNKCRTIVNRGTSFSAPIVAGVIATIMSENNDVKFIIRLF